MKLPHPAFRYAFAAVLAAGSAGCAGPAVRHEGQMLVAAEYEQIYVTGSHIPVRVPKRANVRRVPGISPVSVLTPEDVMRLGSFPMH